MFEYISIDIYACLEQTQHAVLICQHVSNLKKTTNGAHKLCSLRMNQTKSSIEASKYSMISTIC